MTTKIDDIKRFLKTNKYMIIVISIFVIIFLYSSMHICTYILGSERRLKVDVDNHYKLESIKYYIWYNNGNKMVTERIHLSFIEIMQMNNNSGYVNFKQLGTFLTHRSAFVYSVIYDVIFLFFATSFVLGSPKNNKKEDSKRIE